MKLVVNGKARDFEGPATLTGLIAALGLDASTLVVEHNGELVRREDHGRRLLREGDRLELVRFVGGG